MPCSGALKNGLMGSRGSWDGGNLVQEKVGSSTLNLFPAVVSGLFASISGWKKTLLLKFVEVLGSEMKFWAFWQ